MTTIARLAFVVVPLFVALGACGKDEPACYAGDYKACTCNNAATGYAVCVADQNQFSGCVCDGTTPGIKCVAGSKGFLDSCDKGPNECASCVCGFFQKRGGNLCTKNCTADSDCPAPSPGCNPQHQCRAP